MKKYIIAIALLFGSQCQANIFEKWHREFKDAEARRATRYDRWKKNAANKYQAFKKKMFDAFEPCRNAANSEFGQIPTSIGVGSSYTQRLVDGNKCQDQPSWQSFTASPAGFLDVTMGTNNSSVTLKGVKPGTVTLYATWVQSTVKRYHHQKTITVGGTSTPAPQKKTAPVKKKSAGPKVISG